MGADGERGMVVARRMFENWYQISISTLININSRLCQVLPFFFKSENNREIGRVRAEDHRSGGLMTVERYEWRDMSLESLSRMSVPLL